MTVLLANVAKGQESDKPFHIGVGIGPSFLPGINDADSLGGSPGVGLNLHLLDAGYAIGKRFGITLSWVGGAHVFHAKFYQPSNGGDPFILEDKHTIKYGLVAIGPMYTFHITDRSFIDLKARVGRFYAGEKVNSTNYSMEQNTWSLGYSAGASYRLTLTSHFYVSAAADYASGKFEANRNVARLHVVNLNVGVGVQF